MSAPFRHGKKLVPALVTANDDPEAIVLARARVWIVSPPFLQPPQARSRTETRHLHCL
jgi:hypothetical protein